MSGARWGSLRSQKLCAIGNRPILGNHPIIGNRRESANQPIVGNAGPAGNPKSPHLIVSVLIQIENSSRPHSALAKTYQQPPCTPSLCIGNGVLGTGGDSPKVANPVSSLHSHPGF